MNRNMVAAVAVAGLVLATAGIGKAHGGWFGLGDSSKSADAKKATTTEVYDPNRIASGPKTVKKNSSGGGWFGLGKPTTSQPPKKSLSSAASQSKKDEHPSWWNSWFKPKEPPPPKNTAEWMKLKPVRW